MEAAPWGESKPAPDFHNSTVRLKDSSSFNATQVFGSLDFAKGLVFIHMQFEMRLCCHFTLLFTVDIACMYVRAMEIGESMYVFYAQKTESF